MFQTSPGEKFHLILQTAKTNILNMRKMLLQMTDCMVAKMELSCCQDDYFLTTGRLDVSSSGSVENPQPFIH